MFYTYRTIKLLLKEARRGGVGIILLFLLLVLTGIGICHAVFWIQAGEWGEVGRGFLRFSAVLILFDLLDLFADHIAPRIWGFLFKRKTRVTK